MNAHSLNDENADVNNPTQSFCRQSFLSWSEIAPAGSKGVFMYRECHIDAAGAKSKLAVSKLVSIEA